jgi:predicted DNA-binding transcriptional regulator AlpA
MRGQSTRKKYIIALFQNIDGTSLRSLASVAGVTGPNLPSSVRMEVSEMPRMLSTEDAAPLVGVSPGTLQNWRVSGTGPKFIKAGRSVVYDPADIESWKAARRFSSTSERAAA